MQSNLIVKNECRLCNLFIPSFYNQSYSLFYFYFFGGGEDNNRSYSIKDGWAQAQNRPSWHDGLYVPRIQAKFDVGGPHIIVFLS